MSRENDPQLISVIVPVFDVEDHVAPCIAALRAQTHSRFEVLVIDDGSTDATQARARAAIGDDPRFRLIVQGNRGLSGARNAGLDLARGDLVAFVDGDDQVAPDFLWQMSRALERSGADWIACAVRFRNEDDRAPDHGTIHSAIHGAGDLAGHVGVRSYPLDDWRAVARHFASAWNKLYRRSLIEGLRFSEGTWFEDHGFYWRAAARTDRIAHLPQPLYLQTRGRAGQITAQDDDRVDQQFAVLDDLKSVIDAGDKSHADAAFTRIASRLLFERTTALRDPERRARYARAAAAYLAARGLVYSPDWDPDVARSFALELEGALPLSVVIAWDGVTGDLAASLAALAAQHGPGREVLVVVPPAAAGTAGAIAATHPEARIVAEDVPGGADAARDRGIALARGRFVQILDAGDIVMPGALQRMVDAMLTGGARLGVMPHLDPDGTYHAPFAAAPDDPRVASPRAGPFAAADLIALRPVLPAMIFERDALRAAGAACSEGPSPAWRLALAAAGPEPRIATLGWAGVTRAPVRPAPPDAGWIVRVHDARVRAVPPALAATFPAGWQRRLFARTLHEALARAPGPLPTRSGLRFLARLQGAILRRGLGGGAATRAELDPDMPLSLERIFDTRRAMRTPRAVLAGLFDIRPPAARDNVDHMIRVPVRSGVTLSFTAKIDGAVPYANLGLLDAEGRDVVFHLSLQGDAGRIAVNDRVGGVWNTPLHLPLDDASGPIEIRVTLTAERIVATRDGREICAFPAIAATRGIWRKIEPGRTFEGLGRIAMADPQGAIDMATFRVTPHEAPVPPGRLVLDDRLILRGRVPGAGESLRLSVEGAEAPRLVVRPRGQACELSAPLPGRLWRETDMLRLAVVRGGGDAALAPLEITRDDMLARIEAALAEPGLRGDAEAAMLVIEHVRFARLEPALSAPAQAALVDLAAFYGLRGFLAEANAGAPAPAVPAEPPAPETGILDIAVARVSQGLRADPPADAAMLLAQSALPRPLLPVFFLRLSEAFTFEGRDPAPLLAAARDAGIADRGGLDTPWTASTALPFLFDLGAWDALGTALATLAEPCPDWIATSPFAWILEQALARDDVPEAIREEIVATFRTFTEARAADYWGRTPCRRLTGAAARLAKQRPQESAEWAIATYGLSRQFWEALGPPPPELAPARAAFDLLSDPGAAPDEIAQALAPFAANPDRDRWARARLGPAGVAAPAQAAPVDLLRHMACPGTAPVVDPRPVARALPALYPDPAPKTPAPPHDTIVVVFSCRAHLDTRIPALRSGWLARLSARGIPHIVVVGGGTGTRTGELVELDAPDDYEGLPQKTLAAIAWVRDHTAHTHMMKIDDDCFLNVDAVFDDPAHARFDYHGRTLTRVPGQLDRSWHMAKSASLRGRFELDRSPEPSVYADGGSGYTLSRRAMDAAFEAAASPEGQALIAASFMEDKLLGDLLRLRGIEVCDAGWPVTIRRRPHPGAIPVPAWQGGFDASRVWPVKLTHLDAPEAQAHAAAHLESAEIAPAKIWPGYQEIRLGYRSNALELVSDPSRVEALRAAPVAVIAAMRNEMFMIEHFLGHYRRLGVTAFAIADNLSDDGTLEYLASQPDVAVFSVDTDYRHSQYGTAWQEALMAAFRPGKWSLVADADEFLVWQDPQTQSLPELLSEPDFEGVDAARIFMLDMYPQGSLARADFRAAGPFAQAGFCEAHPFLTDVPGRGPFSDRPTWTSALRHRLIPGSRMELFVAQKYALLRYGPQMRLSAGLHYVAGTRLAPRELLFAHFKYNADFRRKAAAEVARRQHFNDAEEYRRYLALTSEGRDVIHERGVSVPWTESPFVRERLGMAPRR